MLNERPRSRVALGIGLLLASMAASSAASPVVAADEDASPSVRTVVIGPQYRAKAFHRWLWGAEYRDLYTTPVELPVLDLHAYAGGLKATRRLGHGQSQVLSLRGADGRDYTFRSVIKDPTNHLPVDLRETVARKALLDQMASGHPAGHLVAPELLQAAGVLHNEPHLVIMPDDPALGEYRQEFANLVGDIEEWGGSPGFGGTTETIDGEEMWTRLRESPDVRIDSRAYLKARLVDQLLGDWDRNRGQFRWGKVPSQGRWQPIPEDRDQAFVRFEGLFNWFLRPQLPLLAKFGPEYSSVAGLTYDGWDVDKRVLADLEWPVWEEVATELQGELTDEVIDTAARLQPPEFYAKDGARLVAGLKARRDGLPAQAQRFYRYINKDVDVFCTDAHELVEARRFENGDLELSVRPASVRGEPLGEPYFQRRFEAARTQEVRVYLYGGNDKVAVTGGHHGGVLLRVVGGDGVDVLDDSAGGGTRFSAAQDQSESRYRVAAGPGTHWDRRPYPPPPPNKRADWIPARDWGRVTGPLFQASFGSDYGAAGRRLPQHHRLRLPQGPLVGQAEPEAALLDEGDGRAGNVPRTVPLRELAAPAGDRRPRLQHRGRALLRRRQHDDVSGGREPLQGAAGPLRAGAGPHLRCDIQPRHLPRVAWRSTTEPTPATTRC